jgi:hypothetical protein
LWRHAGARRVCPGDFFQGRGLVCRRLWQRQAILVGERQQGRLGQVQWNIERPRFPEERELSRAFEHTGSRRCSSRIAVIIIIIIIIIIFFFFGGEEIEKVPQVFLSSPERALSCRPCAPQTTQLR